MKFQTYQARSLQLSLDGKSLIMGILNVTPDSFSDGGRWTGTSVAVTHAQEMMKQGAAVIDVGGESTRPGSHPVTPEEEWDRIGAVVKTLVEQKVPLSVDTWKSSVALKALEAGVPVINDIYGLQGDPALADVIAQYRGGVILMNHPAWYWPSRQESQVFPKREGLTLASPEILRRFESLDVVEACLLFLDMAVEKALKAGIPEQGIMVDPGLGFGLSPEKNLQLINELEKLQKWGYPILLAPSRKRFIRHYLSDDPKDAEIGTAVSCILGCVHGANLLRVHDVAYHQPFLQMTDAILSGGLSV